MTTRESLHQLLDELTDEQIEALARIAREHGIPAPPDEDRSEQLRYIDARQYPALVAAWDNDDDDIFDEL